MRALAALKHTNIAYILDFGETLIDEKQVFYLAMEYIAGKNVIAWSGDLKNTKKLFALRLTAAVQIAQALQAAHETAYADELGFQRNGVLHGSIKPDNVIVTDTGEIKLLNFLIVEIHRLLGLRDLPARFLGLSPKAEAVTLTLDALKHLPPEQATDGLITVRTDIFCLGVLLCQLFFPGKNKPYVSIKDDQSLPRALKSLLVRMLSPAPEQRPSTMSEVVKSLGTVSKIREVEVMA